MTPCPFCHSTDLEDCYVYIKCNTCGAEGPKMNGGRNDNHADFVDHEMAVDAWNKRVAHNATEEQYPDHGAVYYRITPDSEWEVDRYDYYTNNVKPIHPDSEFVIAGTVPEEIK